MLFAGWEVCIVKNCDRGNNFSLYLITYLFFSKLSNEKKNSRKKTHASVTVTVKNQSDCRIRYRARLEKNK